jgi:NADPH:quinone reductase-like Zn-dependent oxidoreductase
VKACAINYPDVLIIEDKYQFKPPRPFAPGGEVAGVVEAVGEGVSGWSIGDRLIAMIGHGGLAEKVIVPAAMAVPLPEGRSFEEGSALILTYATTIHALLDRGQLKRGETLLVLGAAGGVGLAAIELGKAYGARVIAAVYREDKAEAARSAGADATMVYPARPLRQGAVEGAGGQFKAAVGGEGANLIYDPVGGDYCRAGAAARSPWEGRYLVIGFPGRHPEAAAQPHLCSRAATCAASSGAPSPRAIPQANAAHIQHPVPPAGTRQDRAQGQPRPGRWAGRRGDRAHGGAPGGGKARRNRPGLIA